MTKHKKVLFTDVDGVLVDYNLAYITAFNRHFNTNLQEVDPLAYGFRQKYNVPMLSTKDLEDFYNNRSKEFWSEMQPLEGAKEFVESARSKGYEIIAVSAAPVEICAQRHYNLENHFGINHVFCVDDLPKSYIINAYHADIKVFVDDFCEYFWHVGDDCNKLLYGRNWNSKDNPNTIEKVNQLNLRVCNNYNDVLNNMI